MTLTSTKPEIATLQNCDDEPIRIPGAIQPHGTAVCTDEVGGTVTHVSSNCTRFFGVGAEGIVGRKFSQFLEDSASRERYDRILNDLCGVARDARVGPYLLELGGEKACVCYAIRNGRRLFWELFEQEEEGDSRSLPVSFLSHCLAGLGTAGSLDALCRETVSVFRRETGYDRVMIYRFSKDGSGSVVAESKAESLPRYEGMRYPATDIPKQARALYLENKVRIIPDVGYEPVDLLHRESETEPVDLSLSTLRSVSPLHLEYLRNMGVGATLCVSIISDGELLGLVACHHYSPKILDREALDLCELFGDAFSLQFQNCIAAETLARRKELETLRSRLRSELKHVPIESILPGLRGPLLRLAEADAVLVKLGKDVWRSGITPSDTWIERFMDWLKEEHAESKAWSTSHAKVDLDGSLDTEGVSPGILVARMESGWDRCVLWFRQEVEQTVEWAGKPEKLNLVNERGSRLSPRKSFDLWRQKVRGRSEDWDESLVENAANFVSYDLSLAVEASDRKKAIQSLEETAVALKRSNADLSSFAYAASHDLQEPLRAIAGCLQILTRKAGDSISEENRHLLKVSIESAHRMQDLVSDLLAYSRLSSEIPNLEPVDVQSELDKAMARLSRLLKESGASVRVEGQLPTVLAIPSQLATVFQNLIGNSIKFRSAETPVISIAAQEDGAFWTFEVSDNGIGIESPYFEEIFRIFSRLHTHEEYEGSGIGLSITRKIIERCGGRIWAEEEEREGACFRFTLPICSGEGDVSVSKVDLSKKEGE